jgi:hypothetical protein
MRTATLLLVASSALPQFVAVAQDRDQFADLSRRRDQLIEIQAAKTRDLQTQLVALSSPAAMGATVGELAAAMRRDSARLALLEELNRRRIESQFELQAVRYHTGLEILRVIMRNTEKLDFTTGLAGSLATFQEAANPLNSPAFREQLASLGKGSSSGSKLSLPDLLLKNPIVSTGFFLASLLSSGLKPEQKEGALAKLSCVLDFTTQAHRDAIDVHRQLESVDVRTRSFLKEGDAVLTGFTAAIGAERDWARYKRETATAVRSPVNDAIDRYFETHKAQALGAPWSGGPPDQLIESGYHLEQTRILLSRHEDLLAEVDGFLGRFESTARRYDGVACPAIPNLTQTVSSLIKQAQDNRAKFRTAWYGDIPAKSRAMLAGARP